MSEELQSLLEKINADGVRKAEAERDRIIAEAEKEAAAIIAAAKAESEKLNAQAQENAENFRQRAISAARQSARDIMLQLRAELNSRLAAAIGTATAQALTPEFMAELIKELTVAFAASPDTELTVQCAVKDRAALDAALKNALAASLKKDPELFAAAHIASGMQIEFKDDNACFDFTGEAVAELLTSYAGTQMAEIFKA